MERNTKAPTPKDKINYIDASNGKLSYIDVAAYYFPGKSRPALEKIVWEETAFPYVGDKQKILDQLYSFYINSFSDSVNDNNRRTSVMSF